MGKGTFTCIYCGKEHLRFIEKCPQTGEQILKVHKLEGILLDGRYRLGGIIGEGGMGVVYEGHHEKLGSRVAVKFLRTDIKYSQEMLQRFENEAKVAASLGHKNIVSIFDMGSYESIPYFVMEFLEGEPLDEIINAKGILLETEAVDIAIQILQALNAVHSKGIIHRDLKPENIVIVPQPGGGEIVKILDFGICRLQSDAGSAMRVTRTGAVFGTPYYMSPEQAEGRKDIDSRADLYSVGAILYKMLTGRTPFIGENYNAVIVDIINKDPDSLRRWNKEISIDLEAVIMKALSRNRDKRFLDASEFIEALEPFSSVPVKRERRSSALEPVEEKREPVPDDMWEEFSVVVHKEEVMDTIPMKVVTVEKEEKLQSVEKREREGQIISPPVKKGRLLSWDSTAGKLLEKRKGKEKIWLLPAGIIVSVVAVVMIVWGIFTISGKGKEISNTVFPSWGLRGSASLSGAKALEIAKIMIKKSKVEAEVKTQVEESSLQLPSQKMSLVDFSGLPPKAKVFVDGVEAEVIPVPVERRVKPYKIEIKAPGYYPFIKNMRVQKDILIEVVMKPEVKYVRKGSEEFKSPVIDTKYPVKKKENTK